MARVHRTTARHFYLGVAGLLVLAVLAGLGALVSSGGEIPARSYSYATAAFDSVGTLKVRQDVRQNSLIIGQISNIRYERGQALVTLRLNGEREVHRDASAVIWQESALAKSFVELNPGTPAAGPLGDGVIPSSRTEDGIDLDQLLNVFDPPTRSALSSSLTELGGGLLGHSADLQAALRKAPPGLEDLGTVATAAASKEMDLPALLASANRLVGRLDSRRDQLRSLLAQTDTTLAAVNVDNARPLDVSLQKLPPTLAQAKTALDSLNAPLADVESAVTTIRPGGQALGESTEDLRGVLREGVEPLGKVPGVAEKAEPAVEDLTRTVADARPLAPRLLTTLDSAETFVSDLAPYSADIGRFFSQLAAPDGLLSGSLRPGEHYFGIFPVAPPGPGLLSVPDPTFRNEPYPAPGTAYKYPQPRKPQGGER